MLDIKDAPASAPAAHAASANGTPASSPDKGPTQAAVAPQAEAKKDDGQRDWKAEYERYEKDRLGPVMAERDKATNDLKAANTKNAELEGAVEGAVETVHSEWEDWIRILAARGLTGKQMVLALEKSKAEADDVAKRGQASSGEALSIINAELRAGNGPFADYLDTIKDAGGKVTAKTVPTLRAAFEKLNGTTPTAAAVETVAAATSGAKVPPTSTAVASGAIPPAPVYRPGMKPRDFFRMAFTPGQPRQKS